MTLARRVLHENRRYVWPLVAGLLINLAVYAFVVYPLGVKSATAVDRSAAAAGVLDAAERDMAAARALVAGKTAAEQELATFYQKVLPPTIEAARRLTYAKLPALARKANVKFEERRSDIDQQQQQKNARLGRLQTRIVLEGDYESLRQLLFELETTPEFLIVDDVSVTQSDVNKPLMLTLDVSTYYRLGPNGA
jgi:Type II secretion system (T2SS), protein M subtype b